MENKILVAIPARFASKRFPGKPLAKLEGKEIILWVCEKIKKTEFDFIVATDDERIFQKVTENGFKAVMTSESHRSGTERIEEAVSILEKRGERYDSIINVQGDEPFVSAEDIKNIALKIKEEEIEIATLIKKFPRNGNIENLEDANLVKAEISSNGKALMFSRSVIPYIRGLEKTEWTKDFDFFTHIGVYAYKRKILSKISSLPPCSIEVAESLEQLRWLNAGIKIYTVETSNESIGIDTQEDLKKAEKHLKQNTDREF